MYEINKSMPLWIEVNQIVFNAVLARASTENFYDTMAKTVKDIFNIEFQKSDDNTKGPDLYVFESEEVLNKTLLNV